MPTKNSSDSTNQGQTSRPSSSIRLSDYILKSREERIAHIDLSEPCDLDKMHPRHRGDDCHVLDFLGVENDVFEWKKAKICRCHACPNDSHNGRCGNPKHIYIGTESENQHDQGEAFLKWRGKKMAAAAKVACEGKPRFDVLDKYEEFVQLVKQDPSVLDLSLRELGRRFEVHHQTIGRWKDSLLKIRV